MATVKEVIKILKSMDEDSEVLSAVYHPQQGITTYTEATFAETDISRDSFGEPIECKEGDGGNEVALIIC